MRVGAVSLSIKKNLFFRLLRLLLAWMRMVCVMAGASSSGRRDAHALDVFIECDHERFDRKTTQSNLRVALRRLLQHACACPHSPSLAVQLSPKFSNTNRRGDRGKLFLNHEIVADAREFTLKLRACLIKAARLFCERRKITIQLPNYG